MTCPHNKQADNYAKITPIALKIKSAFIHNISLNTPGTVQQPNLEEQQEALSVDGE